MPEYKTIHSFPEGIKVVGMLNYKDRVLLATENALYELIDDELEAVPIRYMSTIPKDLVYPPKLLDNVKCHYTPQTHPAGYVCVKGACRALYDYQSQEAKKDGKR